MFLPFRLWQKLILMLFASTLLGVAAPTSGGRKSLEIVLTKDHETAKVTVPAGVTTVTLQKFKREGGWTKVASRDAVPGVMRFKLPKAGGNDRWRAIGRFEVTVASHDKFPASFYSGENSFKPGKADTSSVTTPGRFDDAGLQGGLPSGDVPVEADIWKVDGDTVYFFNQLRGLQVLNLANPADPRITASLRLPAVGQDLYLLPGSGKERNLVLLTQGWSSKEGDWTRINLVKVSGGKAEITNTRDVPGYLADSRMVGNRLILATSEWNQSVDETEDEWNTRSHLTEWLCAGGKTPQAAGETVIEGDSPVIATGADWLALAVYPNGQWDVSEVSVFAIRENGLVRMAQPVRTKGVVPGKFAMQWSNNVLTTVSERNNSENGWFPVTVLENFRAWDPDVVHPMIFEGYGPLGSLQLAKGESLFATRFAGDKAYIVTFLQTDPLFVIDLSDPKNPMVAGQIEVPGWSSHLEPLGDLLFAIGWESNTVVASLFDVADPAAPQLLRRVKLGAPGTYSEAMWDEQALKLLPGAGLALIPLTSYDGDSGESKSVVQLLDVDTAGRDLHVRGTISHEFDARRADLLGNTVVSISQRVMVAADVTNRDAPAILSEVSLAWPVDRVFETGGYLLQIEDGSWYRGQPVVRVSPAKSSESILSETSLGKGAVKAADCRDGKLYVLRDTGSAPLFFYSSRIIGNSTGGKLVLDIYDVSSAPALTLLGSCIVNAVEGGQIAMDHLLWPQPNRPALVMDFRYSFWFGWGPIFVDNNTATTFAAAAAPLKTKASVLVDLRPYWVPEKAPRLIVFDTTDPQNPVAADPVVLGPDGTIFNRIGAAADGLIVLGNSQWKDIATDEWLGSTVALQTARVIEVESSGSPIVRPLVDLPGELFAVTELDHAGFLAFTRTSGDFESTTLQVSACDGYDAFSVASLEAPPYVAITAGGRRLFVATEDGVERHRLTEDGTFATESPLEVGWQPDSLRWIDGTLVGGKWNALFASDAADSDVTKWKFPTWNPGVERVILGDNGDVIVPFGDYGVERLER
ncbi:MAG: beta-propeller domain-containing protein [Luteolibacter sp.]|uniref:beta-propeller domain-containing protein n=1 Tax=Luteolibacter sp. TaxID=1962973 RepID=UPI003263EC69